MFPETPDEPLFLVHSPKRRGILFRWKPAMYAVEAPSSSSLDPKARRWTKAEFYHMAELGWFDGQRAELVNGEILGETLPARAGRLGSDWVTRIVFGSSSLGSPGC
jgi:hypothetical protein